MASARRQRRSRGPGGCLAMLLGIVGLLGWMLIPVPAISVALPPLDRGAAQPGLPWLSTSDGKIVDDSGRVVLLRGFNIDALLDYTDHHPAPLELSDVTLMEQEGFDVVRLPIAWSLIEPQRGHFDSAYLQRIENTVALLNSHGMYVVFDMHFLDWSADFGGAGAPNWARIPAVPDIHFWPFDQNNPWNRHLSPAVNAAMTYFWTSIDWQRDFMQSWQFVAKAFRGNSGVAGYDLFNEPHPLPLPPLAFEKQSLWPLYARTINAIGAVDPNHIVMVEGILFADVGTTMVPLHVRNLVYSPHIYTGSLVPPAFTGDRTALQRRVADQAAEARVEDAPMWTGEFGIDFTSPHATEWADAILDAYDDQDSGWAWWQWRQDQSWSVRDEAGNINVNALRHLARPYLIAAPAGVRAGHGNGVHGYLALTAAAGTDADVTVAWPGFTAGRPVLATVRRPGTPSYDAPPCAVATTADSLSGRMVVHVATAGGCAFVVMDSGVPEPITA